MSEREKLLSKYPALKKWLSGMPDEYLEASRTAFYQRGQTIFRSGDWLRCVYIICSGIVMISSSSIKGNEMNVVYVREGSTLGEMEAVLQQEFLIYSAFAFTDCFLLEIPYVHFDHWISKDINACKMLNQMFADKLYQSSSTMVQYNNLEASTRLKMFFLNHGQGRIKETREELAKACGVNVRTIYRSIKRMQENNLITLNHGKISLTEEQIERLQDCILREDQ